MSETSTKSRRAAGGDPPATPWWASAVIYQLYLRSFRDTNGDGIGDLNGVIEKLDYVAALGVDALWLSPFYKSPMQDFGYDICDFRSVDPTYGEIADLDRLVLSARERGLRTIVDFTPCHTSKEHPWFRESRSSRDNPKADWYVWADARRDGGPPTNWLSSFGGSAWEWEPRRSQYRYHAFLECQPNLNLRTPEVVDAILGEMAFWLDRGIDGIRLDAVQCLLSDPDLRDNPPIASSGPSILVGGGPNNPFSRQEHPFDRGLPDSMGLFERMRALADRYGADRFLLGEASDVDSIPFCTEATAPGRLHAAYHFDLINSDLDVGVLRRQIRETAARPEATILTVAGNQDSTRLMSNWGVRPTRQGFGRAFAKLMCAIMATQKGGALVFQGEELGLTQAEIGWDDLRDPWGLQLYPDFAGRDGCRTPMPWEAHARYGGFGEETPWLPFSEDHRALAVDRQEADPDSVLNAYRRILAWRRDQPALRGGTQRLVEDAPEPLVVYERAANGARLLCAFNLSDRPFTWRLTDGERDAWRVVDGPGFGGAIREGGVLALGAYDGLFAARRE
ncbi:alpha-amylase family glycosyl hydrolase [Salinarimonas sp. NSM]|uniref:alpha-amylase family glycosyl hydrolase n=1 Tax=Salinarimonas sp. NSM TaxID=3458003 RepID=UPI004036C38F